MRRCTLLAVLCLLASSLAVSPALAAPALAPPVPGRVLLAFGAPYAGRVHEGLDVAGEEAASARAPAPGSVTFAGRLPGGTGMGVTITTGDGLKVTCSPLSSVSVTKGESVAAGDALGKLAGEGDGSSGETHVHLSVRQGETYMDPEPLVSWPAAEPAGPSAAPAEAPAGASAAAPAPAAAPAVPAAAHAGAARPPAGAVPSGAARAATASDARLSLTPEAPAAPASAASLSALTARAARAHPAPRPLPHAHHAAVPDSGALASLRSLVRTARLGVTALAAGLVALAMLWPVWRRANEFEPDMEPVVAEARE